MTGEQVKHPPPWLFGITGVPYGIVGGFCGTTMPFLTRKSGIDVGTMGWFGFAVMIPPMLQFLYAPIIDIGPKRKHWLIIVTVLGAACLCTAMMMPLPQHVMAFLGFTVAGQLISGLVGSCNGGLLATTIPDEKRGAAAGWINAGNLGGGALGSWVAIEMTARGAAPLTLGLVVAAMMIGPSLAALAIVEAERERRTVAEIFGGTLRDVWAVARSKPGYTGMLFCISPVGTAALINYFSGLAVDYHASEAMVAFVNGPVNGLLTAGGSLLGGFLCDRLNRRAMYLASGALTALCGLVMMVAPLEPNTYAFGVSAYLFIAGLCYASFSAVVLEAIGKAGRNAGTQYTLFTAAGNAAIAYTGLIDTRFHKQHGVRGLLAVDAGLNLVGVLILGVLIMTLFRKRQSEPPAQAAAA